MVKCLQTPTIYQCFFFFFKSFYLIAFVALWLEWLRDEAVVATTTDEREKVYDLFERAVKDYLGERISVGLSIQSAVIFHKICLSSRIIFVCIDSENMFKIPNSLASERWGCNYESSILKLTSWINTLSPCCEIDFELHMMPLVIGQHWFRWWLGVIRWQVITWANVDLCCHTTSPGRRELASKEI